MNKSILTSLLLISSFACNTVIAAVTVTLEQQQYDFIHDPRLVEVLAPIANKKSVYWPAASLYYIADTQLEKTRQLVLNNIATVLKRYATDKPQIALSLERLQSTITSWRLARRLPIKIDYDLARIVDAANPRLASGKYILAVSPRMNTVQLFGAVNQTDNVPHLAHTDVSKYITQQTLTALADKDYVMIIQADGRKIKAPAAYWNKAHQEVMPGSQLFVPFNQSIFTSEFAAINQQIMYLALNRVR
jgi:hypothetical protein